MRIFIFFITFIMNLFIYSISSGSDSDMHDKIHLLNIIEKYTDIATKTKINSDYVPGIITVIYSDELEASGFRTVWDALESVPGVELNVGQSGSRQTLFRGFGSNIYSGNIKVLLDGISVNAAFFGKANPVLNMPVEQVERIEVIRGPGSALYGEFAYSGVVNVVTHKKNHSVYGRIDSDETYTGGGKVSYNSPLGDFNVSLNLSAYDSDGHDNFVGKDRLYSIGMGEVSNAPGDVNEDMDYKSAIFHANYKKTALSFQLIEDGYGDHLGLNAFLPPNKERVVLRNKYKIADLSHEIDWDKMLKLKLSFGLMQFSYKIKDAEIAPQGFSVFEEGMLLNSYYEELRIRGGMQFKCNLFERHRILADWSFDRISVTEAWQETNYHPVTFEPLDSVEHFTGNENWVDENQRRFINSFFIQDEYDLLEDITLTTGLRYDYYDDIDGRMTPRFAAVYRLTDRHILKIQYTEAFRPPTFYEMYRSDDIDPEIISTSDIGYIYAGIYTKARLTMFYSKMDDIIAFKTTDYINAGNADIKGVEAELEKKVGSFVKIKGNITYADSSDIKGNQHETRGAYWLGNLTAFISPVNKVSIVPRFRFVGTRTRFENDTRNKLKGYSTLDLTLSAFNIGLDGLMLYGGVKNIFKDDVIYPVTFKDVLNYIDDYPRTDRKYFLKVSYKF